MEPTPPALEVRHPYHTPAGQSWLGLLQKQEWRRGQAGLTCSHPPFLFQLLLRPLPRFVVGAHTTECSGSQFILRKDNDFTCGRKPPGD